MMRKYRSALCALLALGMALSLCACGRGEDPEETTIQTETGSAASGEASAAVSVPPAPPQDRQDLITLSMEEYANKPHEIQPGTVLNYCAWDFCYSFLPWIERSYEWLWGNIYEGLLYMYMNDPTDIRGCIAESWTHSDDYLTWTFKIREGVRFTDGTVCDANAIVKCWDFDYGRGRDVTDCSIDSWEATGPLELVVRLSAPCAWFEVAMCGNPLYVLSPTALELYGREDSRVAVGTGPYRLDSLNVSDSDLMKNGDCGGLVLKANPDYYIEERMPCIETVNVFYIRGQEKIMDALLSGKIDGAVFDDVDVYNTLKESGFGGRLAVYLDKTDALWFNVSITQIIFAGFAELRR
jgi:ABC-type transport system substrate-binding protein